MKRWIVILLALSSVSVAWGGNLFYNWTASSGNWDTGTNWDVGSPATVIAYTSVTANTSGTITVRGLGMAGMGPGANILNNGGTINLVSQSGSTPTLIVTSTLNNSGQINVTAGQFEVGNSVSVIPYTDPTIPISATGGGTINLTGGQLLITSPLTLAAQTIQGAGSGMVTCNGNWATPCLTLPAGNVLTANGGGPGQGLVISGTNISNGGILQAANGGTLQLGGGHWSYGPTYVNGGIIQALDGSTVRLGYTNANDYDSAGAITGSTLNTTGTGQIVAGSGMVLNGITNNANFNVVGAPLTGSAYVVLAGTINNAGAITLAGGSLQLYNTANQGVPGIASLTGGGTVNMGGYALSGTTSNGANGTLTNVSNLIQGAGGISNITMYNQAGGLIDANTNGQTLSITGSTINNSGTLQASNGGTLQIGGGHWSGGPTYVNGGTIQALNGSTVLLGYTNPGDYDSAGTITGSTLNTAGSGVIQAGSGMVLDGVTNNGNLSVVNTGTGTSGIFLANTIDNRGSITLAGGNIALNVQTFVTGAATLTGGGTVNLGGYTISGQTNNNANGTLTNVDNHIQGAGSLSNLVVNNQSAGVIAANTNGQTLSFSGSTLYNSGTLAVSNGGTLQIASGLTNLSGRTLTGGTYNVGAGTLYIPDAIVNNAATLILDGASSSIVYSGGDALASTFADNQAGGTFELLNGRNFTTAGAFSNEGTIDVGAGSTFTINGAFTNSGSLDVNGSLNASSTTIGAGQSLYGSGTINGNVTVDGETDPGNSPGILTVNGNYTQAAGSFLNIQLGGTTSGQFDQLDVNGNISLDGTLDVTLWGGFLPGSGNTFDILNWTGARTGNFAAVVYPALSAGYSFEALWAANSLTLEVLYTPTDGGGGNTAPEPATCLLIVGGLLVGSYHWRRRRQL